MNIVALTGRLVADADVRYTQGTQPMAIASFRLAVDRAIKREGQPSADFINCKAFGKTAEFIEKYFKKGMKMEVKGSWQTGSYKKDDGTTVYTNDCICEQVGFAESKSSSASTSEPKPSEDGFVNVPDGIEEELPFM